MGRSVDNNPLMSRITANLLSSISPIRAIYGSISALLGRAVECTRMRGGVIEGPGAVRARDVRGNVRPDNWLDEAWRGLNNVLPARCSLEGYRHGSIAVCLDCEGNRLGQIRSNDLHERVSAGQEITVTRINRRDII